MKQLFYITAFFICLNSTAQKTGRPLVDSLIAESPGIKNDTFKARTYNRIFNELTLINADEAMLYANKGLQFVKEMKWQKGISVFQNNIGRVYSDRGNYDSAIFYFNASIETGKKLGEKRNIASTYNNMGVAAQNIRSDYTTAASYYFKALQLAEVVKDSMLIPAILMNISVINNIQKNFDKAFDFSARALAIYEKTGNADGIATSFKNFGEIYVAKNDIKHAEEYYNKALNLYQKMRNNEGLASVLSALAMVYGKDYRKAIETRLKAREIWKQINPFQIKAITNTGNIGITYLDIVRYDTAHTVQYGDIIPDNKNLLLQKAEQYLKEAISFSEQAGETDNRSYFLGALSELQGFKGDYKNAYYNLKTFKEVEDSIYSQENKNKIAAAESQREIDKKNSELKINRLALSNQQKKMWGLAGGLILFSVIGFLLYRQVQIKKKNNALLVQLNSELDEANKVKAKFFGILSHDLRNPIARFVTLLDLQNDDPRLFTAEQSAVHQKEIGEAAGALLVTMEEMLLWSKGQMENFKPQLQPVPVNDLFVYIENSFLSVKGVSIGFTNPKDLVLNTDVNYLQTIMYNLTSNAIKAVSQKADARIEWKAFDEDGKIVLSISDNGDGITDEYISLLNNSTVTANAKTGFGLHLIRDLAKAIQCIIKVQANPGRGTIFYLNIYT
jgi:signal transduction histidine kinase